MRPYVIDVDPANVDADGLADGNSSAGATLTLDGALTSGGTFTSADGLARRISILDLGADDQSGATYTFTGTDADGLAQTEDIAGPTASGTVTTSDYWLTVTSVAIASAVAGSTVDVGTVDEACSPTLPLNYRAHEAPSYQVDITGTIDMDVQTTLDDIRATNPSDCNWHPVTNLDGITAGDKVIGETHSRACRVIVNSFTATAETQVTVYQNED